MNARHSASQAYRNNLLKNGIFIMVGRMASPMSLFHMSDFAFAAYISESNPYMQCIKRAAFVQTTPAAPCEVLHGDVS